VPRPTQQTNDKVRITWHTRLSRSLAALSKAFCSQCDFVKLYADGGSIGSFCRFWNFDCSWFQVPQKGICLLQPLLDIRLPTYLPLAHPSADRSLFADKFVGKNLKSLGSTGFARHYFRHRCLLSFPRGTKMFQFPRLPQSNPIYSDRRHMALPI
jgi:hypothetical protein